MLKWARQNGCPWEEDTCSKAARGGPPRAAPVGEAERRPVGPVYLLRSRRGGAPGRAPVGKRERRPVGRLDLRPSRPFRPPGSIEMGRRQRRPLRGSCRMLLERMTGLVTRNVEPTSGMVVHATAYARRAGVRFQCVHERVGVQGAGRMDPRVDVSGFPQSSWSPFSPVDPEPSAYRCYRYFLVPLRRSRTIMLQPDG